MSVSKQVGEEFYLIEIKNSDIQVSSDFCFLAQNYRSGSDSFI